MSQFPGPLPLIELTFSDRFRPENIGGTRGERSAIIEDRSQWYGCYSNSLGDTRIQRFRITAIYAVIELINVLNGAREIILYFLVMARTLDGAKTIR